MIVADKELRQELLRSRKFLEWLPAQAPGKKKASYGKGEPFVYVGEKYTNLVVVSHRTLCDTIP